MSNTLTPAQQTALRRDVNLAVTAGAGTGKTSVLVERYLDILLTRFGPLGQTPDDLGGSAGCLVGCE